MGFWHRVNKLINKVDILIIVGDARVPQQTMNSEIIKKLERKNKKIIRVFNKADLISKTKAEEIKKEFPDAILTSATKHKNTMTLLRRINAVARGDYAIVGVVGYPNTGKSSVINAIKGRKSAPTSSVSGFTKGLQIVRVSSKIKLVDSPGVIPFDEHDEFLLAFLSAKSPDKVKDPEDAALQLIESLDGKVEEFYNIEVQEDSFDALELIAKEIKAIKKGNLPDNKRAAVDILNKWQMGKIKV